MKSTLAERERERERESERERGVKCKQDRAEKTMKKRMTLRKARYLICSGPIGVISDGAMIFVQNAHLKKKRYFRFRVMEFLCRFSLLIADRV